MDDKELHDLVVMKAFGLLEHCSEVRNKHNCGLTESLMVVLASRSDDPETIEAYCKIYFPTKKKENFDAGHFGTATGRQQGMSHMADALRYGMGGEEMQHVRNKLMRSLVDEARLCISPPVILQKPEQADAKMIKSSLSASPSFIEKLFKDKDIS